MLVILLCISTCSYARLIYVDSDAPGNNNGTSWENAYKYLQDALSESIAGDEILLAEGIYCPDENTANPNGTGSRGAYFQIKQGIKLFGGFAGLDNQNPDLRNIDIYKSILSGDLNGDDGANFTNRSDNARVILRCNNCTPDTKIDGVVITAAYETGWHGGGLWNEHSSPTINRCVFIDNASGYGGGITNRSECSPVITHCLFIGNKSYIHGAGIDNVWGSSPLVQNCVFILNTASSHGGAISNDQSCNPTVINSTIFGNTTGGSGGGIINIANSNPKIFNTIIWGNSDSNGSGFSSQFSGGNTNLISYSCIQGWNLAKGGIGNMDNDPLLDLTNYHLLLESPCINAGDPAYLFNDQDYDIDEEYRVLNDRIDIGADEVFMGPFEALTMKTKAILSQKGKASDALNNARDQEAELMDIIQGLLSSDMTPQEKKKISRYKIEVQKAIIQERMARLFLLRSMNLLTEGIEDLDTNDGGSDSDTSVSTALDDLRQDIELQMADTNFDGKVDMNDFILISKYWFKKY
jgi:predicted outer membrane repeat protein